MCSYYVLRLRISTLNWYNSKKVAKNVSLGLSNSKPSSNDYIPTIMGITGGKKWKKDPNKDTVPKTKLPLLGNILFHLCPTSDTLSIGMEWQGWKPNLDTFCYFPNLRISSIMNVYFFPILRNLSQFLGSWKYKNGIKLRTK